MTFIDFEAFNYVEWNKLLVMIRKTGLIKV